MTAITIQQLADTLQMDVTLLLDHLGKAGIAGKTPADTLDDTGRKQLLEYMTDADQADVAAIAPKRISLRRKSSVEKIKFSDPQGGRAKPVEVRVVKVRTYTKRNLKNAQALEEDAELAGLQAADAVTDADVQSSHVTDPSHVAEHESAAEAMHMQSTPPQSASPEAAGTESPAGDSLDPTVSAVAALEEVDSAVLEAEFVDVEYAKDAVQDGPEKHTAADKPKNAAKPVHGKGSHAKKKGHGLSEEDLPHKGPKKKLSDTTRSFGEKQRLKRKMQGSFKRDMRSGKHAFELPVAPMVREVAIPELITVGELAQRMAVKAPEVIKQLMKMGMMMHINQAMDQDTAVLLVEEMGHKPKPIKENALEESLLAVYEAYAQGTESSARPPVVTIMGHVDHGKTSLLDYIRRTKVVASESGGITQHIGAYRVDLPQGSLTFLDTPGHAAFSAMRARGANCTDIVILVVAADDGVMPQTVEAIQHAQAAAVPLIVAVTKIDKDTADMDKIKSGLSQYGITPEEWGGESQFVGVSAKTGEGVDALLDSILVQSEMLELRAVATGPAKGVVIESRLDKGRGPVATILVQTGLLQKGDAVLVGQCYGRIRAMTDITAAALETAGPSTPVEILGLSGVPQAGDELWTVSDERKAKEVAATRQTKQRERSIVQSQQNSLETLMGQMASGENAVLNIVLKADVQGSVEAIAAALQQLAQDEVQVRLIVSGVGGISESDAYLAASARALILGFNVRADGVARRIAESENLSIRYYSVIYDLIDDVKQAVSGLLKPEVRENIVGVAQVRDVFRSSKFGAVAGCMVQEGVLKRHLPIRVLRNNVVIYEGQLESLRRFKDDVSEVRNGTECGVGVKDYNDVRSGDQIEVFERVTIERTLQ